MTATRVIGPNGHLSGAVSVLRDISAEKALQEQKEQFVAYASHELRTPITNLKTRLYLMRKQPERLGDHLTVLEEVADRMRRLVEDLLDMSRFERGVIALRKQRVVLQDLACNVTVVQKPEAEHKCLELSCEVPPHPIYVEADPERLVQVITNLLNNAIKYSPPEKNIRVTTQLIRSAEDLPASAPPDVVLPAILVTMLDQGKGLTQDEVDKVFMPFFRTEHARASKIEGVGLGLPLSRSIIEMHRGKIWAEPRERASGGRFLFTLPIVMN